jgi:glutaredoxin
MERVIVLGLSGCGHCESLVNKLEEEKVEFEYVDANENDKLADRMEALLKTEIYPIVILEKVEGSTYLYRTTSINEAQSSKVGYATKIGCVTSDNMVAIIKKHFK